MARFRRFGNPFTRKDAGSQQVMFTQVPGAEAIPLARYYESLRGYYPRCELQTKRFFVENVKDTWVCLDVGANIGYHTILLSRLANHGQVFAFEPTKTYDMLLTNLHATNASNVIPIRKAVGASSGPQTQDLYRIWGDGPERTTTEFITIDDFVFGTELARVDLIKIDIDGFDLEALWGAEKTLATYSPIVVVELNHALATRGHSPQDAIEWMLTQKYSSAIVLDRENFAFTKNWALGMPWPNSLDLTFDNRDPKRLLEPQCAPGTDAHHPLEPIMHNATVQVGAHAFALNGPAWEYAVSLDLEIPVEHGRGVKCVVRVQQGDLGVFLSDSHGVRVLTAERVIRQGTEDTLVFELPAKEHSQVVFRKATTAELCFEICEITSCSLDFTVRDSPMINTLERDRLGTLCGEISEHWHEVPLSQIEAVSFETFCRRVGISSPIDRNVPLSDSQGHLMERQDAPLLAWIYQHLAPKSHFEFGTWEGFGTALCLRACSARIWTLNLEQGECDESGHAYMASREPNHPLRQGSNVILGASDSGESIGWMYRHLDDSGRVTQLLGDSTNFDFSSVALGTFDTVLVDGSHARSDVLSDSRWAMKLLNPNGIIIWHDFSLDPEFLSANSACRGVAAAIADCVDELTVDGELLWVENSMLLVRVPKR